MAKKTTNTELEPKVTAKPEPQTKVFGTKEWAESNLNCVLGCSHGCWYCYACAMRMRCKDKELPWVEEELRPVKRMPGKKRIMFPSTHDITPNTLQRCLESLSVNLAIGHSFLIVSKPHLECIKAICEQFGGYKDRILFRFTIGSANDKVLRFWEPNAPSFGERMESLRYAFKHGFQTSVSCEPMLDGNIEAVIKAVEPYVSETIWVGKMNKVNGRLSINKAPEEVKEAAQELIRIQCDENIRALYERNKKNSKIRWKDSIKKVMGLAEETVPRMSA